MRSLGGARTEPRDRGWSGRVALLIYLSGFRFDFGEDAETTRTTMRERDDSDRLREIARADRGSPVVGRFIHHTRRNSIHYSVARSLPLASLPGEPGGGVLSCTKRDRKYAAFTTLTYIRKPYGAGAGGVATAAVTA